MLITKDPVCSGFGLIHLLSGVTMSHEYNSVWRCVILRAFLLYINFFGYFTSLYLPLQESSCRQFFPIHLWRPFWISKWPLFPAYYSIPCLLLCHNYDFLAANSDFFLFVIQGDKILQLLTTQHGVICSFQNGCRCLKGHLIEFLQLVGSRIGFPWD